MPIKAPLSDDPPLVQYLRGLDISAQAHEGGVLVFDHYALLDLLQGEEDREVEQVGPAPGRKPKPLDPDSANPVGVAQEYCQGLGKPLPEYRFEFIGTETAPMFRCNGTALGRQGSAEAASKAQAKERAARALIRDLQAARRTRHG